ncbi:siderophore-interacting protein [Aeromicrobium sp. YIM 150415]|uniref:siderophore-interacting protein n=1 Tax=Aeromicrobium sp. YIM 150415 TaxID=2803912 RepID=UPI0027DCA09C|nr:siderophore-interacting protein [Aeromicrobium sp. YIM 150415]
MSKNIAVELVVQRTEELAPRLRRVILGGPGFEDFAERDIDATDKYVKLAFLRDGFDYPEPLDLAVVRETMPAEARPILRTYTVRWVDLEARELAIDFVVHGDEGLAGPWAAQAKPGDRIHARGPGGAYAPKPEADHHLFIGDESALPAIAAALERLPSGASATAFLEVDGPTDQLRFSTVADLDLRWLHRAPSHPGTTDLLDTAVRGWTWPQGRVQAFVHGESALLKTVRPYLLDGRVDRADLSVSAYWRHGVTEEGFREWKSTQADAVMRPTA